MYSSTDCCGMLRSRSAFTARSRSLGASARARMMSSSAVGILSGAVGLSSARLMALPPDWRKIAPGADPDQERPVPTETWLYVHSPQHYAPQRQWRRFAGCLVCVHKADKRDELAASHVAPLPWQLAQQLRAWRLSHSIVGDSLNATINQARNPAASARHPLHPAV